MMKWLILFSPILIIPILMDFCLGHETFRERWKGEFYRVELVLIILLFLMMTCYIFG